MTDLIAELRSAIEHAQTPEIMTTKQASVFLGVSEDYLLQHRKRKTGPAYSQPEARIVRYLKADLIDWLQDNRIAAK
ncbi:MAG: helix-turn-helix domain-containing protein [Pseudomonadota bacterium]